MLFNGHILQHYLKWFSIDCIEGTLHGIEVIDYHWNR